MKRRSEPSFFARIRYLKSSAVLPYRIRIIYSIMVTHVSSPPSYNLELVP